MSDVSTEIPAEVAEVVVTVASTDDHFLISHSVDETVVGTTSEGIEEAVKTVLTWGNGSAFQLVGADGNIHSQGQCSVNLSKSPLEAFGVQHGCTAIQYRDTVGCWVVV